MKPTHLTHRPTILAMAHVLVILLVMPAAIVTPPATGQPWNSGGDFALSAPYDSGQQTDTCYVAAPWGRYMWGVEGSGFDGENPGHAISLSRFTADGEAATLSGREEQGIASWVRYTQGTAWGQTYCGAIPWNRPVPLPVAGTQLILSLDLRRDAIALLADGGWVRYVAHVWLTSPALPKPLALDVVFYDSDSGQATHFEDETAYHYRLTAGETPAGVWQSWHIALNPPVADALAAFGLTDAVGTLRVSQLDFAIELKQAEGAATIDNFFLRYAPFTPTPTATPTLPVLPETVTPTPTFPISWETEAPTETPTPPVQAETATPTATPTAVRLYHFLPMLLK